MFERDEKVPITKEEIRAIQISKARLSGGCTVHDVGCGSGSMTVEACVQAGPGGRVHAIDRDPRAARLTRRNLERFGLEAQVLEAEALDAVPGLPEADAILVGGTGNDSMSGGAGEDWLHYDSSFAGVSVNLATGASSGGFAQGDTLADASTLAGFQTDFEAIWGSQHADTLTGSAGDNTIEGYGGADVLSGGDGTDELSYFRSNAGVSVNLALKSRSISSANF